MNLLILGFVVLIVGVVLYRRFGNMAEMPKDDRERQSRDDVRRALGSMNKKS